MSEAPATGAPKAATRSEASLRTLADFRYTLRRFVHFSEEAATRAGLAPQQHQLMLQIAGTPPGTAATVSYLAERLVLRHHTVVELSNRCEAFGLIARKHDPQDRRVVVLRLTAAGHRILRALSQDHTRELDELAPRLIQSLQAFTTSAKKQDRNAISRTSH